MPMPFTILHKVHISFAACIYISILITCQVLEGLPHLLVFKQKTVLSYLHMLRTWYYLHLMLCTGVADPCCNRMISLTHRAHSSKPISHCCMANMADRRMDGHGTISQTLPSVLWRCWLGGNKGIRSVKNWVVGCWHGYLSGTRCRLAYGPADATATHCLLLQ